MPDELHDMAAVAGLDAVDADGVPVGGVAGAAAVEVVHGEARVGGDLVQALAPRHGLLNGIVIVIDLIF